MAVLECRAFGRSARPVIRVPGRRVGMIGAIDLLFIFFGREPSPACRERITDRGPRERQPWGRARVPGLRSVRPPLHPRPRSKGRDVRGDRSLIFIFLTGAEAGVPRKDHRSRPTRQPWGRARVPGHRSVRPPRHPRPRPKGRNVRGDRSFIFIFWTGAEAGVPRKDHRSRPTRQPWGRARVPVRRSRAPPARPVPSPSSPAEGSRRPGLSLSRE